MPILLICPNPDCGELFDAPADAAEAGLAVCPSCGAQVPVGAQKIDEQGRRRAHERPAAESLEPVDTRHIQFAEDPQEDSSVEFDLAPRMEAAPEAKPARPRRQPAATATPPADDETAPLAAAQPTSSVAPAAVPSADAEFRVAPDARSLLTGGEVVIKDLAGALDRPKPPPEPEESIMARPLAGWIIIVLAVLGLLTGSGLSWLFGHNWLALYAGAAAGWVLGFAMGFLLVLSADRGDSEMIRCPQCGRRNHTDSETCGWCGGLLPEMNLGPMALGCLRATRYAAENKTALAWMGVLTLLLSVAVCCWWRLDALAPGPAPHQWIGGIVAGVLVFLLWGYLLEYMLDAIGHTGAGRDMVPRAPAPGFRMVAVGFWGLALPLVYLLPILTVPLLPIALASMSRNLWRVLTIPSALVQTARRLKDVVVLWLLVLLYTAGAAVAVLCGFLLHLLTRLVPAVEGPTQIVIEITLTSVVVGLTAPFVVLFLLAIARCVGLFLRYED